MTRRIEVILAAVLLVAGATSLALQQWVFVDPTQPSDWERGAAWIIENTKPGDVVRIEPFWYETGLTHLVPVGSQVQRIRDPLFEDLYAAKRVLILAQADRADAALASLPFPTNDVAVERFGSVSALQLSVPPSPFTWELYDELDKASVSHVRGAEVEKCTRWNAGAKRWDCAKPNKWTYVGQEEREVGDDPRRCVWAHPLDRGRTLRIEFEPPPAKTLRIRDSFDLRAARLGGDDVLVQVFVNDELVVEDRVAGNDHDWQAHDIDIHKYPAPKVRIEIDLLGSIKNRYLCLNAWTIGGIAADGAAGNGTP